LQHPNFVDMGSQGYPNDIAVITFSQQVIILPTNPNLQTIQLADASTALTNVAIMGWGRTSGNETVNSTYRVADFKT
jgi:Trypsin